MKELALALIPAALPTLMVLVGILLNQNAINRVDGRLAAIDTRMTGMENGLRAEIAASQNSLRAEIAASRKQSHDDIVMLLGHDRDQDIRITRLEGN